MGRTTNWGKIIFFTCTDFLFYWDSLHARLNSHYKACSYNKKEHKKIKAYRKSLYKEPPVNRCLLILNLGQRKAFYRQRIPKSSCARKEIVDIEIVVTSRNSDRKIMQSIRIRSRPPREKGSGTSWASSEEHLLN